MNYKKITPISAVVLVLIFCIYMLVLEKHAYRHAQARLEEHARIISNDLWNYNNTGASEYLKLASESDHYEILVATDHGGVVFHETVLEIPRGIHRHLIQFKLIPRVKLLAHIEYGNNIIGWLEAIWLPQTFFIHAYVFFALTLLFVVISLYTRLLKQKATLEDKVRERTNEMLESNTTLKQEISERIKVEEALRDSDEKHRFLAENISDVIWTTDLKFNYTYISPVSSKLYGWSVDELKTLTINDTLTPKSIEYANQIINEYLELGHKTGNFNMYKTIELEMYNKDGTTRWCEITASFLVGEDNIPHGIMGVTRDITERLKIQKEKEALQKQLNRSKKMESLGLLAGGVAHDLNNVLSGIVTYPELLLLDMAKDNPLRKPIIAIKKSGQKAAAIVEDLLSLARRGVIAREALNMNQIISEYLESPEYFKLLSYHPHVKVDVKLEDDLPYIMGSAVHMKKTVMNLVSNAAEAQPNGGSITISTESRYLDKPLKGYNTISEGEYVLLSVSDHGEGISESDLHHVFEPFYTKKVMGRSGTGLGLAVVWGTVQDHDGHININTAPGHGTEFALYFPLTRKASEPRESIPVSYEDIRGNMETILVVDDIKEQREIAEAMLKKLNYNVQSLPSGEDAVNYLQTNRVDLVILDMIMEPGMDGLETYNRILKTTPGQKAIIASGFSETDRVKEAQKLGAGEYVKKPYMLETIGKAIKKELTP